MKQNLRRIILQHSHFSLATSYHDGTIVSLGNWVTTLYREPIGYRLFQTALEVISRYKNFAKASGVSDSINGNLEI